MVRNLIRQKLEDKFPNIDFDILVPTNPEMGDYSTNIAFVLAKKEGRNPEEIGKEVIKDFNKEGDFKAMFSKIEFAKPGFINFYLSDDFLREHLNKIVEDKNYGFNETMKSKVVMVEYTDPNPFKLFHIGHLMSNAIGEAISRLYESSGARVLRVTWQGDVGMHIAMAVWAIKMSKAGTMPSGDASFEEKMNYLGKAYATGAMAYKEGDTSVKKEIEEVNKSIYKKDGDEIDQIYNTGRQWSLDYFEEIYNRLGSKFDHYFFESELGEKGMEIVRQRPDVFEESEGAVIFKGEKYGLHTRVFINSSGLPVYESKELGLNKEKFELYNPDLSIIITGNEINEYFKVLLKVMELTMPEVAAKTRHISHGMLRLPTGKMSSRTGDVITADSLIEQIKNKLPDSESETKEKIAIGAIKYSILKQSLGHDIIFNFEKSLSVKGDSAPYLQYTYARLNSILEKDGSRPESSTINFKYLVEPVELALIKQLIKFPDVVMDSGKELAPQYLALYLYELANTANRFYESVRVLDNEEPKRLALLALIEIVASILKKGLDILGIETPKRI